MTTFGGGILAWSAEGDINAGRGAKTTVVYTPPRRVYDAFGNVALSPNAPSSGAGIATLAPIAEVPAGDVDLHAPLGTIDAGEAGIRVSGNINIAALHVVNAANIQVKGERHSGGGDGQHRRAGVGQRGVLGGGRRGAGIGAARPAAVAPEPAVCHQRADPGLWRRTGRRRDAAVAARRRPPARATTRPARCRYWEPRAGAGRDARPDGTGARQTVEVMAAVETLLPVMSVSHRRGNGPGPGNFRPWSVPAGLPRGAGAVT